MNPQITIATFDVREPAVKLVETLAEYGISADIADETELQKDLMRMRPHAAVHVIVERDDVLRAEMAMRELHDALKGLLQCPACGKSDVVFPQFSRKFPAPHWIYMLLCKIHFLDAEYYCERCHYTWSAKLPELETVRH